MIEWVKTAVSLTPVFVFLAALIFLDSYKLVRLSSLLVAIATGGLVAGISLLLHYWLLRLFSIDVTTLSLYIAPVTEEVLKALFLLYCIRTRKVGFMVDAAIYGFAIGAGFAFIENVYYLQSIEKSSIMLWIVRGFGTAALHGTTTAIFGILSKGIIDRHSSERWSFFLPGLTLAVGIHMLFNHFILPPVYSTILLLIVLPIMVVLVFARSERATRNWLGKGMDTDIDLLDMITSERIDDSHIGKYLETVRDKFPGPVVADMLCLLRLHSELAIGAKGVMLMRQTGFEPTSDPEIKAKFVELRYLEKSLGKTGRLAIQPFLKTSSREMWQLYMIGK